jgi:hypothetical protein
VKLKNKTLLSDTSEEINKRYIEFLQSISCEERFERMDRLCAFGKLSSLEGLKEKNPQLNSEQLIILFAKNLHGETFSKHIETKYFLKSK